MPDVTRIGDLCTGHDGYPSRPAATGARSFFVNGIPAHRVGDFWITHRSGRGGAHGGVLASGSASFFVEGQAVGRIGDPVDCGSLVATGDPSFIVHT